MRTCNDISKDTISKEQKEACYSSLLRVGPSAEARVTFRREPYYLTAAKREKAILNNN